MTEHGARLTSIFVRGLTGFLKAVTAVLLVFGLIIGSYLAWMFWEVHSLRSLCGDVRPGMAMTDLPKFVTQYGFNRRWGERGIQDGEGPWYILFVPASSTMGDVVCAIRYDNEKHVVTSAEMWGERGPI